MVTVGLVKELNFISAALKTPVEVVLTTELSTPIHIKLNKNILDVTYQNHHIWHEEVEGDTAFFGIESCDTIARIVACINNNDWESGKLLVKSS